MIETIIIAALAYGGWKWWKKKHPSQVLQLQAGKTYALNVLANTAILEPAMINTALSNVESGAFFEATSQPSTLVKSVTYWPGIDLTANYGGTANQWIAFMKAKKSIKLPYQGAPTLIVTSAFEA